MLTPEILKRLQSEQKKLDEFICQKKNLTDADSRESFIRTKIALLVEIGELANELKTFKHWKSQKEVNWEKAKEELIDCLHFYLSWANSFQIDFSDYKFRKLVPEPEYNELLLALFSETESFSLAVPFNIVKQNAIANFEKSWQKNLNDLEENMKKEEFEKEMEKVKKDIEKTNISLLEAIKENKNKEIFYRWLIVFEELAYKLGMKNEKDIEEAYMTKNKINWQRQQKNY
jgi:dimeric dUTPase (all-alpha-NTP-PPase superfamily)